MPGTGLRRIYASALMQQRVTFGWLTRTAVSRCSLCSFYASLFSPLLFLHHCSTLYFPFFPHPRLPSHLPPSRSRRPGVVFSSCWLFDRASPILSSVYPSPHLSTPTNPLSATCSLRLSPFPFSRPPGLRPAWYILYKINYLLLRESAQSSHSTSYPVPSTQLPPFPTRLPHSPHGSDGTLLLFLFMVHLPQVIRGKELLPSLQQIHRDRRDQISRSL